MSQSTPEAFTTLADFVQALTSSRRDRDRYNELFRRIRFDMNEVRPYCNFDESFYTRNLIARTEDFELILLCWQPGQATPIHDHAGSDGWMFGLAGTLEEVLYTCEEAADGSVTCTRGDRSRLRQTEVSYINDDIGLHAIENTGPGQAASLHLYSPPIDSCLYYSPDERRLKQRKLTYHTTSDAS